MRPNISPEGENPIWELIFGSIPDTLPSAVGAAYKLLRNLSPEHMNQLWGGLFGSIPSTILSAAAAAYVAITVLNRSNRKQHELADRQIEEQRILALQLAHQQLEEQRRLTRQQLEEQRHQASRERELAAISELLTVMKAVQSHAKGPGKNSLEKIIYVNSQIPAIRETLMRWQFEVDLPFGRELQHWEGLLIEIFHHAAVEASRPHETWLSAQAEMDRVTQQFIVLATLWGQFSPTYREPPGSDLRENVLKDLTALRESYIKYKEDLQEAVRVEPTS